MREKLTPLLMAAALLLNPLQAAAKETTVVKLTPPVEMSSAASVGMLSVLCDASMYGSEVEVHLYQQEGDLLYYTFPVRSQETMQYDCPLMRDGEYHLIVKVPQETTADPLLYSHNITVEDPDPADRKSEFDSSRFTVHLSADPNIEEDTTAEEEPVLADRVFRKDISYTYARKALVLGDMDKDNAVDASDATKILIASVALGAGEFTGLSSLQTAQGDVNGDGELNAEDATIILSYAANTGANAFTGSLAAYVQSLNLQ